MSPEGDAQALSVPPAEDPTLRRIERDHALIGALLIAASLWAWKRIALRVLSGAGAGAGRLAAQVIGKSLVTLVAVFAFVRYADVRLLPFVLGTAALPAALLVEAFRGSMPHGMSAVGKSA